MENEPNLLLALGAAVVWALFATAMAVHYNAQASNCALQLGVFPQ